jgi:hypothetical protein
VNEEKAVARTGGSPDFRGAVGKDIAVVVHAVAA